MAEGLPPPQDTPPPTTRLRFVTDLPSSIVPYRLRSRSHSRYFDLDSLDFDSYSRFTWADSDLDSDDDIHYATLRVGAEPLLAETCESRNDAIIYNHFTAPYVDLKRKMEQVWTKQQWEVWVRTMYKRKGKKIHPVNVPLPDGIKPGGDVFRKGESKGLVVERGSRLTPERLAKMKIGNGFLSDAERQLFVDILFEYEGAVAFEDSEMGLLHDDVEPPIEIHTVPHEPWQQQNIRLPKAMQDTATAIVKEKLELGILEHSQGPYRSRYFIVQKKNGSWRLINDVQPLNGVTIKESGSPPSTDEFSEDFAGYPITSAIDHYSGYYQISVHPKSRDMTAFVVPDVGSVRMTRLPQGWTNSVSSFQRVIGKVHWQLIPDKCRPFVDDTALK